MTTGVISINKQGEIQYVSWRSFDFSGIDGGISHSLPGTVTGRLTVKLECESEMAALPFGFSLINFTVIYFP